MVELSAKLNQTTALTPQMEQSVRILQMDTLQLGEYLRQVVLENTVAELEPPPEKERGNKLTLKKMEWLESQTVREKENVGYYEEDDDASLERTAGERDEESLVDHLLGQVAYCGAPKTLWSAIRFVIGCVDENGYLRASAQELALDSGFTGEEILSAVAAVQGFEPAGVGAASLSECLTLQLDAGDALARSLAGQLEEAARKSLSQLAATLAVSETEAAAALERIRRLNPKPGSRFGRPALPRYITPDVVVTSFESQYNVMLCEFNFPDLRWNQSYVSMAAKTDDPEVAEYLGQKINQITWIQKCIDNRNKTLLNVARAIVKKQERFFRYGPQYLNVLRMKDVALQLEMHESTVSRAVRDKYLQCTHGLYPLRHFFVKGFEGSDGAISAHQVRGRIKELVAQEDAAAPRSDQILAELLASDGFAVSRRTVAKYREELGIPASGARRRRGCR